MKNKNPLLIVLKEQYGNNYFLALNEEDFNNAIYKIVSDRYNEGYWYSTIQELEDELKEEKEDSPEMSLEQVNALKDGKIKEVALREISSYGKRIRRIEKDINNLKILEKALKEKNYQKLYAFLCLRQSYEYENFDIIIPKMC